MLEVVLKKCPSIICAPNPKDGNCIVEDSDKTVIQILGINCGNFVNGYLSEEHVATNMHVYERIVGGLKQLEWGRRTS